jgi:hypothetical protein
MNSNNAVKALFLAVFSSLTLPAEAFFGVISVCLSQMNEVVREVRDSVRKGIGKLFGR